VATSETDVDDASATTAPSSVTTPAKAATTSPLSTAQTAVRLITRSTS
jgi:hypothetical protein